jgi:hypothetical protein
MEKIAREFVCPFVFLEETQLLHTRRFWPQRDCPISCEKTQLGERKMRSGLKEISSTE